MALLECMRGLARAPPVLPLFPRASRQARELANMFVACANIRPVCGASVPPLARSVPRALYGDTGISLQTEFRNARLLSRNVPNGILSIVPPAERRVSK